MSKAATDHLTRCAALELAPHQVRVNAVNPGLFKTDILERAGLSGDEYEQVRVKHSQSKIADTNKQNRV